MCCLINIPIKKFKYKNCFTVWKHKIKYLYVKQLTVNVLLMSKYYDKLSIMK